MLSNFSLSKRKNRSKNSVIVSLVGFVGENTKQERAGFLPEVAAAGSMPIEYKPDDRTNPADQLDPADKQ